MASRNPHAGHRPHTGTCYLLHFSRPSPTRTTWASSPAMRRRWPSASPCTWPVAARASWRRSPRRGSRRGSSGCGSAPTGTTSGGSSGGRWAPGSARGVRPAGREAGRSGEDSHAAASERVLTPHRSDRGAPAQAPGGAPAVPRPWVRRQTLMSTAETVKTAAIAGELDRGQADPAPGCRTCS